MTSPNFDPTAAQDALHEVTRMLVGTQQLQDEPGVVYNLMAQKAHPQDAQAIDQFMQSLEAEKRVKLARAAGEFINLNDNEKALLDQNNVSYTDVQYSTSTQAAQSASTAIEQQTKGVYTAKLKSDGTLDLAPDGSIQRIKVPETHGSSSGGWFSSFGSFVGHLGSAIKGGAEDVVHPVLTGVNKGWNWVNAELHNPVSGPDAQDILHGNFDATHIDSTSSQEMQAAGYDPTSFWSSMAYAASGKKHTDLSQLNDQYGVDQVTQTLQFLNDPKGYKDAIARDPANYVKTADGQTALTPDAQDKLKWLQSKDFEVLARKLNAHQATVGNDVANAIGIDPVNHATAYNITAAGANIAASFVIDPTMIALQSVKVAKLASVGLNTLGDSDKAASILTRKSYLPWVNNVQRGWQKAIDLADEMRTAHAAGDSVKLASLTAKWNAELPALAPLMGEFVGEHALLPVSEWGEEIVNGERKIVPTFGKTDGIRSMEDAAAWVKSKHGFNLLMNGRAATQASLMPGALSAFGYRKLKGMTAGLMTARSAVRAEDANASALARLGNNETLRDEWLKKGYITERDLTRMSAQADDAVDPFSEEVLASPEANGELASAQRAQYELTPAGKGEVVRNLRGNGDVLGERGAYGYFSPAAVGARFRLAAQRFSTLLPRNTLIDINDAASGDKIYKLALTYLNRGDANALRAAWNFGGGGERKAIIGGLVDQLGHAAGLGKSATGRDILNRAKTSIENYSAAGSEIELQGQKIAQFEGQTRDKWLLPTFQAMQQASAKLGLWESVLGRPMTSAQADMLMSQWKIGALFKPSTVTRNQLEGWLRTALEGRAGDAIKARSIATARNKELWDRGYGIEDREAYISARGKIDSLKSMVSSGGLSQSQRTDAFTQMREAQRVMDNLSTKPIVQHLLATETGDLEKARLIERSSMLSGDVLGRSAVGTKLADLAPLAFAGRAYRALVGKFMDEETVQALLTMSPHDLSMAMEGYGQQILASDLGLANAAREATEIAQNGFGPAKIRRAVQRALARGKATAEKPDSAQVSWTHQALDGTVGADRYATALAQRVNAMPETARAALDVLENQGDKAAVVRALEKESKKTAFGKIYFEDPNNLTKARLAVTDAEREAGKADWAQKVIDEYGYLLSGQNGKYQQELGDFIREHGHAPDGGWIADHLTGDNRPPTALFPEVMAMPAGGAPSLPKTLQDIEGGAYQWLVERPLQRTTSSPVFLANYAIARKGLNKQVEQLVEHGFSQEAADNFARELATRNAWIKTEQLIDDPGQKTQFDVIARNMFPFARATNAMIRRWGTGLWQNPAAARKMMLAYEGAVHSGLIYTNEYGEPTYTYPGSGVMNMALRGLSQVPGFENVAAFPTATDMTGGVLMSVPGADNPFRMSMGPMISIPLREVYKHFLPTSWQGDLLKVDAAINGPIGAGETFAQLMPTAVRKFYTAMSTDDRNSALASSMNSAIANLAAAGLIPSTENADSAVAQQFRDRLQTQIRSHLFMRAVFGLFAPAAPSAPSEGTSASGADFAWNIDGIKQLSDEYKTILNETGGDIGRANAIFTALHPDEVVYKHDGSGDFKMPASAYETAHSGSATPGAYLPSTDSALNWMLTNKDFIHQYSSVAAYFLPNATSGEPFSDAAYKAQLELGLRVRKTPQEFMNNVYVKHAESAYYPTLQEFDRRINDATANGNKQLASQLTQQKSDWEKTYQTLNPLLKAKIDGYPDARHVATQQLTDLKLMLENGQVPDGQGPLLQQLVSTYDNYVHFVNQYPGQTDQAVNAKHNALDMFNRWAEQKLAGTPIADVYNGVFRVLNTNLAKIGE